MRSISSTYDPTNRCPNAHNYNSYTHNNHYSTALATTTLPTRPRATS